MAREPPIFYDIKTTCPLARWCEPAHDRLEYSIEDLAPCVTISSDGERLFGWSYRVTCPVFNQHFSSRYSTRKECISNAAYWLAYINCPGHIYPLPEKDLDGAEHHVAGAEERVKRQERAIAEMERHAGPKVVAREHRLLAEYVQILEGLRTHLARLKKS